MNANVQSPAPVLPAIGSLTARQQRGMDCVFCCVVLTPAIAVDIDGEHYICRLDTRTRWFPRRCRDCPKGGRP
ncbi:hypothetical protein [Streptomyces sp. NPDC059176]|uniref:hypothetical protein n=1 Tax=unclassified Streptomyces TaxID=2593676 RepID=UPI00367F3FBD